MELSEYINKSGVKPLLEKYKIYKFNEDGSYTIPNFRCVIEKNKDVDDKRVRRIEEYFPFYYQVAQCELGKTKNLKFTLEQVAFAGQDKCYTFLNGTLVTLVD